MNSDTSFITVFLESLKEDNRKTQKQPILLLHQKPPMTKQQAQIHNRRICRPGVLQWKRRPHQSHPWRIFHCLEDVLWGFTTLGFRAPACPRSSSMLWVST